MLRLLVLLFAVCALASLVNAGEESKAQIDENEVVEPSADGPDAAQDPSHGFGADIDWVPWPQAVSVALDLNRPIFLLIHKSWCGACQLLKKSFNTSTMRAELVELSAQFVMVNTEDDEEPQEEEYAPDGGYIPRLFILNKQGKRLAVDNKKNYPSNAAYFPQVPDVVKAMKKGLELFQKEQKSDGEAAEGVKKAKGKMEKKQKAKEGDEKAAQKAAKTMDKQPKAEEEMASDSDKKGGCPHAAGKAAKKAKEEEAKKKAAEANNEKAKGKSEAAKNEANAPKEAKKPKKEEKETGKQQTEKKKNENKADAKKAEQGKTKKPKKEKAEL